MTETQTIPDLTISEESRLELTTYDKGILSLPQIQYLKSLIQRLSDPASLPIDECGVTNKKIEAGQIAFDVIIENQRGSKFFGIALFSKKTLIPAFDPPSFQTLRGKPVDNLKLFPLPDSYWKWSWPSWTVLMIGDVDVDGFVYTRFRFNSLKWKGVYKFGNLVRRRVWIRKREKDESGESYENYRLIQETATSASRVSTSQASRYPPTLTIAPSNSSFVTLSSDGESTIARKSRKRDRLKKIITRKKSKQEVGEQIELYIDDDSVESLDFYEPYTDGGINDSDRDEENSLYESIILENPIDLMFVELENLKLDRQKIEKFLSLVSVGDMDVLTEFAGPNCDMYLNRFLNSLDHSSSRFLLMGKLRVYAAQCDPEQLKEMMTLIEHLESLCSNK